MLGEVWHGWKWLGSTLGVTACDAAGLGPEA